MHRGWTMCGESRIYYPIIKALLLNNIVHMRTLVWNYGEELICIWLSRCKWNVLISPLNMKCHGVMLGAAQCRVTLMGGTNQCFLVLILPRLTCHVFSCSCSKCYRMTWSWGWRVGRKCQHGIWGIWASSRHTQVTAAPPPRQRIWSYWALPCLARCSFTGNSEKSIVKCYPLCSGLGNVFK